MAGKGSTPRPLSVDVNTFSENWDRIFGKKKPAINTTPDAKEESDHASVQKVSRRVSKRKP